MSDKKQKKIILKQLEYPSKVLVAWKEAIGGNVEFRDFLIRSPYKELGIFCFAILNDKNLENGCWIIIMVTYLLPSRELKERTQH